MSVTTVGESRRVFISSTVYDLVDVRSEAYELLKSMGFSVVMSDRGTSDFTQIPSVNSIENCLIHLRTSDACIVILSQRYGPTLGKAIPQYGDVSATHLEYKEAIANGKDVYFYARDRLLSEFEVWKRNGRPADLGTLALAWTPLYGREKDSNALRLFQFLNERSALSPSSRNWVQPFTDSVHLKEIIAKDFKAEAHRISLQSHVVRGEIPSLVLEHTWQSSSYSGHIVSLRIRNSSSHAAYGVVAKSPSLQCEFNTPYLPPNDTWPFVNLDVAPGAASAIFTITYHTATGFEIIDEFCLACSEGPSGFILVSVERCSLRRYRIPNEMREHFIIED